MHRAVLVIVALLTVGCAGAIRLSPVVTGSAADPASPEPSPLPVSQTLLPEGGGPGATPHEEPTEDKSNAGPIVYTCPMHPEVRSDAPGTCPKCGMKLVPVKPAPEPGSPR